MVGNFSILSCSLPASVPAVTVRWYRQATDVLTLSNNRFYIYSNKTTSSLIISHFAVEDANTYDCEISNDLVPDMTYRSRIAAINAGVSVSLCQCLHDCMCWYVCVCMWCRFACTDIIIITFYCS